MEEDKAAAYYDELSRKGSGAARFKQGLGFSSSSSAAASSAVDPPPRASALASSFLSQFVKASNPNPAKAENDTEKRKSHIESIQNKLRKKESSSIEPQFKDRDRDNDKWNDRDRERHSQKIRSTERRSRRSRSRSRSSEDRDRRRDSKRHRRRSRSRNFSDEESERGRERRRRSRRRSRSLSPSYERSEKGKGDRETGRRSVKDNNGAIDSAKLIKGYDEMTPAERVKAKMKLQLSETAAKDTKIGTGSGWERFDFNKDAPLDNEDEEIEGANDDSKVVKHIGQTFRFSNVQARRAEEIQAAHDEAMFGVPVCLPSVESESVEESEIEQTHIQSNDLADTSLFSDMLLSKKQGSWRDRAPRNTN
ncbi:hypothetical protein V2J09_000261 [Rumex salicifolius]